MSQDNRLTALETKVSYQDLLLEKLNDVIYEQQKQIDELNDTLQALIKRIKDDSLAGEIGPANEKPPHY